MVCACTHDAECVCHVLLVNLDCEKHTLSGCCFSPGGERVSLALRKCSTAHFPVVLGRDIDDETGHSIKSDTSEAFMSTDHSIFTLSPSGLHLSLL